MLPRNEYGNEDLMKETYMSHELLEVLPRLFNPRGQDDSLLQPIRKLQQVIRLQQRGHLQHRESVPHRAGLVPPDRQSAHDVDSQGAEEAEIDGGVSLFGESFGLATCDAEAARERCEQVHGDELTDAKKKSNGLSCFHK